MERPGDYVNLPDHDDDTPELKAAKSLWKDQHPDDTLKNQRTRLMRGEITELPWLRLIADNELPTKHNIGFGTVFPEQASKGDTFVRVDQYPNIVYKFNGIDWIQVDKNLASSYTYDIAYIDHLIEKIGSGEYDPDLLSDSERDQVSERLQQNNSTT